MNLRQLFLRHVAQTNDIPLQLEIERAEGCYLFDPKGEKYLDLISGISVSSLGHCHPEVVKAIKEQADKYLHTLVYGEYVLSPQVQLANLMTNHLPPQLDSVYFVSSGSEATEGAMKLAKRTTGRSKIIACRNAYHGSTQGAASLMSPTDFTQAFHPLLPGIQHIEFNNEADLDKIDCQTACVVIETVQAESGVTLPKDNFLQKLRKKCDYVGALLVFDEIQVGFGRTGSLWAFEKYGVIPDILLLAKAMGGGMPIGAFVASKNLMHELTYDPPLGHITTFGGHPVSCAAGLATLKVLLQENYIEEVYRKEALFHKLLVHPAIKEVRSAGLLMAVEVADFETMRKIQLKCIEAGLITDWFLFNEKSLRLSPPLIISDEQIQFACETLVRAME